MVWDTIVGRGAPEPVEEWGGIAYALAALEASLPADWALVPLIKVGRDLAPRANAFLHRLTKRSAAARFVEVPQPNNRVTLSYIGTERRTEQLVGGVPPWRWEEIGPMIADLEALYVNFISGFELDLITARRLRDGFRGPIYADLHSLFLGVQPSGLRTAQPLPEIERWFECFDVAQLNEDELALLGMDPMAVAAAALSRGVGLLVVTLGPQGTVYFTTDGFRFAAARRPAAAAGPIRTARLPAPAVAEPLDPTGCGDVFGGTLVAELLAGRDPETAVARANAMAARNVSYRGAGDLTAHLRGEIVRR